ncbi:MAG: MBL fold metallo-hydrolase [Candidatus Helarchaeota archaeon]
MKLRWLLTAGFEIITDNYKILIDPYISRPRNAVPQLTSTTFSNLRDSDAVFLSHGHFDHTFDIPLLINNSETIVYCSGPTKEMFIEKFNTNPQNFIEVKEGQTLNFDPDFKVTVIKSKHIRFNTMLILKKLFSRKFWKTKELTGYSLSSLLKYKKGKVFGYLFEFSNGKKLFHMGSGGYYKNELEKLPKGIDIFLAPVAGREDCDKVLAKCANIFKPKMIIPHHYDDFFPPISWYAYYNFDQEVKKIDPDIIVNKLEPEVYFEF